MADFPHHISSRAVKVLLSGDIKKANPSAMIKQKQWVIGLSKPGEHASLSSRLRRHKTNQKQYMCQ